MPYHLHTQCVVIEYVWKAYSVPKDFLEAWTVECRITHADTVVRAGGNLGDVRNRLEEMGFTRHGENQIETHRAGRYNPTWREVWTRPAPDTV
jgi:hypothetical protein